MTEESVLPPSIIHFEDLPGQVEIAIVGGGLTGLQLAAELHFCGVSAVLVLEAGKALAPEHNNLVHDSRRAEELWLQPSEDECFWRPWHSESSPHFMEWAGLRRRLGGRSLYWQGVTLPIEDWALVEPWWPSGVIRDLTQSWQGGPSLYELAYEEIRLWRSLPVAPERAYDLSREFFQALGYKDAVIAPGMIRHHYLKSGEIRVSAYSPVECWFDTQRIAASGEAYNLPLIACEVEVLGIILHGAGVKGLRVRDRRTGESVDLPCKLIVLAAGTIENTRLAIQALTEIRGKREPVARGLMDHIVQGFVVRVPLSDVPADIMATLQPGPLYLIRGNNVSRSNLFVSLLTDNTGLVVDAWCMGEQMPNSQSYVRCEVKHEWPWPTFVRSVLSSDDKVVISKEQAELNDLWFRVCSLTGYHPNALDFVDFNHPERMLPDILPCLYTGIEYYTPLTWASPLGTVDHEGGTLPYGTILDNRNEFKEINGLFAVGPCTFPRMGAANPGLTSLVLTKRLAAEIAKQFA